MPLSAAASETLTSPNFRLDPNVANSFGGLSETGNYQLLDSGGEAAIGLGSSDSYKLSSGYIAQLQQSIELNVLPAGLVAYYPLNTGLGIQAYDATPNRNNGVLTNEPTWIDGKIGHGALEFDGVNDFVGIADSNSLDFESESFSISLWFNTTYAGGEFKRLISKEDSSDRQGYSIYTDPTDNSKLRMFIDDGPDFAVSTLDYQVNDGNWHQVIWVVDRSSQRMYGYIDGQARKWKETGTNQSSSISNVDAISTSQNLHIGSHPNGATPFPGNLDEIKLYDRALSADEVLDEFIAGQQGIPTSLTLPKIGSGESQTVGAEVVVTTDAPAYELAISQDGDLRTENVGTEISPIPSSIVFPDPWIEGTTIGFGFTVTDGIDRDGKWGIAPDYEYAAVPGTATTFHTRTGLSGGNPEVTDIQFRLGVSDQQTAGVYRNRLGFTATLKP